MNNILNTNAADVPRGNLQGFVRYAKSDIISGLLVFLIALPLCLGISIASGFPAIAGVFTAIIGAVLTTFLSNCELTIKGPAAGMIVIVLGAVTHCGFIEGGSAEANFEAYRMVLAIGIVAGLVQILFGLFRAGVLGDFFPSAAVHGMLAAIGVIIMLKQIPVALGEKAVGEPLELIRHLPNMIAEANPSIATIGLSSLAIMFGFGFWKSKSKNAIVKAVPSQLVVLILGVIAGYYLDLGHQHTYSFLGHDFELGENFLVNVPMNLFNATATPNFGVFTDPNLAGGAIKWVVMFALIGSLESMLSAKAVDMLDPWKRKSNLNRDLMGIGLANSAVAMIGGLPMISEIVRSKANIDNGAKTRFANFWHGIFLLLFVALLPALIHRIPLAALAAMLVYTGFRLASPQEFVNVYKIGREQLLIFVVTMVSVLLTDLLIGILIGIGLKIVIHFINGLPVKTLFKPYLEVDTSDSKQVVINASGSAVFTNFIPFRREIEQLGLVQKQNVVVDLSGTKLVDHSVMEKLHELQMDFEQAGLRLDVIGLDGLQPLSSHPYASRKRGFPKLSKVTVLTPRNNRERVTQHLRGMGVERIIVSECQVEGEMLNNDDVLRFECFVETSVGRKVLDFVHDCRDYGPETNAVLEKAEIVLNRSGLSNTH
ncbi:MAG: SulP family inorganic anion transporter [Pirellulaceae bacterium]